MFCFDLVAFLFFRASGPQRQSWAWFKVSAFRLQGRERGADLRQPTAQKTPQPVPVDPIQANRRTKTKKVLEG